MHDGRLPSGLTLNHVYGEMQKNGAVYVLRTEYIKKSSDDYWQMPD